MKHIISSVKKFHMYTKVVLNWYDYPENVLEIKCGPQLELKKVAIIWSVFYSAHHVHSAIIMAAAKTNNKCN